MSRWSIDDLITRYTLEPGLQDYFVEGGSDLMIYQSLISAEKRDDIILYDIDNVDIDGQVLNGGGLTEGKRQRIIYLLRQLEAAVPDGSYAGIVDKDLEEEFPTPLNTKNILVTKYRDLESYFLNEDYVNQILVKIGGAGIVDWSQFYRSFVESLLWLHSIRLADRELELYAGRIKLRKYIDVTKDTVHFKREEYVLALLMGMGAGARLKDALDAGSAWYETFSGDPRNNIRGHDFIDLMLLCLKKLDAAKWPDEDALLAAFALTVFHHPSILEDVF